MSAVLTVAVDVKTTQHLSHEPFSPFLHLVRISLSVIRNKHFLQETKLKAFSRTGSFVFVLTLQNSEVFDKEFGFPEFLEATRPQVLSWQHHLQKLFQGHRHLGDKVESPFESGHYCLTAIMR